MLTSTPSLCASSADPPGPLPLCPVRLSSDCETQSLGLQSYLRFEGGTEVQEGPFLPEEVLEPQNPN